jgi:hypothetical protein
MGTDIGAMVEAFVNQLVAAVEDDSVRRVREAVAASFGDMPPAPLPTGPARDVARPVAPVKRRPKQLCPVPGCTGVAAPVFGMVCGKHKDLPKAKIKEFRAQRRDAKTSK